MEGNLEGNIKKALEKFETPIIFTDLISSLHIERSDLQETVEIYLKKYEHDLEINLVQIPRTSDDEKDKITKEYALEYKFAEEKENCENLNDQDLMKVYQNLIFKVNKLKEQKSRLANSEIKNRFIKTLHKYNELKDIGQIVLGKIAELQSKTINEVYEDYDLDLDD